MSFFSRSPKERKTKLADNAYKTHHVKHLELFTEWTELDQLYILTPEQEARMKELCNLLHY